MASRPGPLTQWPWQCLGNFKYALLAPWVLHSTHQFMATKKEERDIGKLFVFPFMLLRLLHAQLWITLSRIRTAKSQRRIIDKSLDFDQVDRERNWDDQIILTAILFYLAYTFMPLRSRLPWWNTNGAILVILLHAGPVEFLYYWLHRALHHHFLYSRYHSHHHSSIVTEPITAVIHPFAEEMAYFALFAIPAMTAVFTGLGSILAILGYFTYVDFMNYMGHCNFELVPKWLFGIFPPLKYLMYTPSYHSLHHTQFLTNYSLFMPFYDYLYGTTDKSTEEVYERSITGKKADAGLDAVHLTHFTSLHSIYHNRFGLASLSSKPYTTNWFLWFLWPFTCASALVARTTGTTFTLEKNKLNNLHMETWVVPRYSSQYKSLSQREKINRLIGKAISEAEKKGAKVVSLGLLNQEERLNSCGALYLKMNPKLKTAVVDGTGLAVAVVLNSLPQGIKSLLLVGNLSKVALNLCSALLEKGIEVKIAHQEQYKVLKMDMPLDKQHQIVYSDFSECKVWLVGDGLSDSEQRKATTGTRFIPFSQFPPKLVHKDCIYHCTPAMIVPREFENLHSCENWLPRRVMSAWRAAGIVQALEGWTKHECGETVTSIDKVWQAALHHGFLPLPCPRVHNIF